MHLALCFKVLLSRIDECAQSFGCQLSTNTSSCSTDAAVRGDRVYSSSLPAAFFTAFTHLTLFFRSAMVSSIFLLDSSYDFCSPSTSSSCAAVAALMPLATLSINDFRS